MLQVFRIPNDNAQSFTEWATKQGMEIIAGMPAEHDTVVSLFRSNHVFSDADIAKSGLPVKRLNHPRFNIELDDLAELDDIRAGNDGFSFGAESIKEYIDKVLKQSSPVTVHTKRENQFYVIYPNAAHDPAHGWNYALT